MKIHDCLFDPLASVNLISVKQLNYAGYGAVFMPDEHSSGLITLPRFWTKSKPSCLPIVQQNN
eukprot:367716-Rhodomonas_salina.1